MKFMPLLLCHYSLPRRPVIITVIGLFLALYYVTYRYVLQHSLSNFAVKCVELEAPESWTRSLRFEGAWLRAHNILWLYIEPSTTWFRPV